VFIRGYLCSSVFFILSLISASSIQRANKERRSF
jgi:hypothetical protein